MGAVPLGVIKFVLVPDSSYDDRIRVALYLPGRQAVTAEGIMATAALHVSLPIVLFLLCSFGDLFRC